MIATFGFHFAQPWWLLACVLVAPLAWMGWRNLAALGRVRQVVAIVFRAIVILLLAAVLARPTITETADALTLVAVLDRSESIPQPLRNGSLAYLAAALGNKSPKDRLAIIDVAEAASIGKLPSSNLDIHQRTPGLTGRETKLADGIQLAMAIAPPETAARILLVSDGRETAGDLKEAARTASANNIPIDVLPLPYRHKQEVVFQRLAAPSKARSGQTVALRFILSSTAAARGKLMLTLNDQPVRLDPETAEVAMPVQLQPGTNVKTVSVPLGTAGMHKFEATFIPEDASQDGLPQNNSASAVTFVAGPGHVLVADAGDEAAAPLRKALKDANIDARYVDAGSFPQNLTELLDTDAIVLVNTDNSNFTYQQQEMLCRYVSDLGGGLVMVGGPKTFGAGGWIGSPTADVLPVDLDPPQKKQMPKGALAMIMHACEMPKGNYWGKRVAAAAVNSLSRLDLVGILDYEWRGGDANWVYPLSPAGDKQAVLQAINEMVMGDMPDFHAPMQAAYDKLKACDAAEKRIIIISDGDSSPPSAKLLGQLKAAGIACTGVTVFPHNPSDIQNLMRVAVATGGNFYHVKDPNVLPQIFIKEAQIVRRSLIQEQAFTPRIVYSLSEIIRGLGGGLPDLDGYVLTGPKGGFTQVVLSSPDGDPILATGQSGLGRSVAFTSSADGRWASQWLAWGGFSGFWEQAIRWVSRPAQAQDCEVFAEARGQNVEVTVEAVDAAGKFVQFADITGQVIAPDVSAKEIALRQVGPGRYRAEFRAGQEGSYLINLRYSKPGAEGQFGLVQSAVTVPYAPEFRDLSDNTPLMTEVAAITGGRVLNPDPQQAAPFDRAGVKFPQTALPLTKPLILAWLALFLLDVAVRRIAVDFRAVARRLAAILAGFRPARTVDETLERLRRRRRQLREQLAARAASAAASRRYKAPEGEVGELPAADLSAPKPPPAPAPAEKRQPQPVADESHLQRLLKAKRDAAQRMRTETDPDEQTGDR